MSDEEGELNEALHASTNAESTTSDDTPWQMQDLHELLSLQQVEEFTTTEIQHILHQPPRKTTLTVSREHFFFSAHERLTKGLFTKKNSGDGLFSPAK